jgi:hypothetical protein
MLIATLWPVPEIVGHMKAIAEHPLVDAIRFNTINPVRGNAEETDQLLREIAGGKPIWYDLKARQLRVTQWAYPWYSTVEISHRIRVNTPTPVLFKGFTATLVDVVDGNRLILDDFPNDRVAGKGEPINILDPSLEFLDDYLTTQDEIYIEYAENVMASFFEKAKDYYDIINRGKHVKRVMGKIESRKGLRFVAEEYSNFRGNLSLMTARDDLLINLEYNVFEMLEAEKLIISKDPTAVAASRILTSLEDEGAEHPLLGDIKDLHSLATFGYRNFLLSDGLCRNKRAFLRAMETYAAFMEWLAKRGLKKDGQSDNRRRRSWLRR